MEILTFMFSLFMGFIAGYFASHIAVNQLNHDRRRLEKEMAGRIDDNDRQIVSLIRSIEELEEMVFSQDDVRNTDGDISNQNFKQIKEFMRQQIALNAQVDQALYVLTSSNQAVALYSDDEVLAVSDPEVKEQKVIDSIKEIMDQYSEEEEPKEEQVRKAKELATNSVFGTTKAKWAKPTDDPREEGE